MKMFAMIGEIGDPIVAPEIFVQKTLLGIGNRSR